MEPQPTLEQLHVFLTVVEKGSFSAAARTLNRAQSVVSYTIANLEAQLGVTLFRRVGTKRPELTEAGQSVLEDARRMVADLDVMR
ncbi:MAG: LysR family transcriptional regulator, partial [Deltaproteobacteria bacterium]